MTEARDIEHYEGLLTEGHYAALKGPDAERLVTWAPPSAEETPNGYALVGPEVEEAHVKAVWLADLEVWLAVHVDGWAVQDRTYVVLETREELLQIGRNAYEQWGSILNPLHDSQHYPEVELGPREDFYLRPEWHAPEPVGLTLPSIED